MNLPLNDIDIFHITRLKEEGQEVSAVKLYQLRDWAGWGFYTDGQYTPASPYTPPVKQWSPLPNNQASALVRQEPVDSTLFADNKIVGRTGDALIVGVRFRGKAKKKGAWMDVAIDIGGPIGRIAQQTVQFVKGKNVEQSFVLTYMVYTLDTWEANGGQIVVYPNSAVDLHSVNISVTRTHAARERLGAERTNGLV